MHRRDKPAKLGVPKGGTTMTRTLALIAAVSLLASGSAFAAPKAPAPGPYKLDAAGKCHAANGSFAKQSLCAAPPAAPKHCKDPKTKKFTKCSAPGAVPA